MNSKISKDKRKELALKYNISFEEVKLITDAPFKLVARTMAQADRETFDCKHVGVINIGKFVVREGRKKYFKLVNERNKNGSNTKV